MRSLSPLLLLAVILLCLAACGPKQTTEVEGPKADPGWPVDYRTWSKINGETIVRDDEGVAREIYAKPVGDMKLGTVLVKEQYRLNGGNKGALELVATMRMTGSGEAGGWEFGAFDPVTRAAAATDVTACIGCHTLQAGAGYTFTPREDLLR